jgi:hypothetical protein
VVGSVETVRESAEAVPGAAHAARASSETRAVWRGVSDMGAILARAMWTGALATVTPLSALRVSIAERPGVGANPRR